MDDSLLDDILHIHPPLDEYIRDESPSCPTELHQESSIVDETHPKSPNTHNSVNRVLEITGLVALKDPQCEYVREITSSALVLH